MRYLFSVLAIDDREDVWDWIRVFSRCQPSQALGIAGDERGAYPKYMTGSKPMGASEMGKQGSRARMTKMTPEQRSAVARLAGLARWEDAQRRTRCLDTGDGAPNCREDMVVIAHHPWRRSDVYRASLVERNS